YELEVGIAKSMAPKKRRRQLDVLLDSAVLLPFGAEEARTGGRIRAQLERAGTPIGPLDTLIAATALRHNATLVTRNLDEFRRVEGLAVIDWY
ncbi:MAG: PIN domain-containing protein, partial [Thermoanaerobaculia bacterium]